MADSAKPPRPPAFDAKTFSQRLHERVTTEGGARYAVFDPVDDKTGQPINFPRWVNWLRNLRDAVQANAIYLDDVKEDLDAHKAADNTRHAALNDRVAALEAQQAAPFPGSG